MLTVFVILVITLLLFITQWIRYDLVALFAICALVIFESLPASKAFIGFSNPAVITVAAVLVISEALNRSGLVNILADTLSWTKKLLVLQITILCLLVAIFSGIMNNVGALALIMPVAIRLAYQNNQSVGSYLIPIAFSSILGGLYTLIGTPTNLIVSSVRESSEQEPFSMFDFFPVGGWVALGGVLFLGLFGWRLIPLRKNNQELGKNIFNIKNYLTELWIDEKSSLLGESLGQIKVRYEDITIVALIREQKKIFYPSELTILSKGDRLIVEMSDKDLEVALADPEFKLSRNPDKMGESDLTSKDKEYVFMEAIVTSTSSFMGRTLKEIGRFYDCTVLAVARHGARFDIRINRIHFTAGDILLIHGKAENIERALDHYNLLAVRERTSKSRFSKSRMLLGLGLFLGAITITILGWVPVQISLVACAALFVLFKFLKLHEAYASIDWSVIILLGALIPLGEALVRSGGANWIANQILFFSKGSSLSFTLTILMVGTLLLSNVINNAATAAIMAPIALSTAKSMSINSDPFLIGIAIASSCAFLTPIGHQSSTLVMEPGGYKFSDYIKVGLPLSIIVLVITSFAIPYYWSF